MDWWSVEHGGAWSHGDAALRNVLYDGVTGRARRMQSLRASPRRVPQGTMRRKVKRRRQRR
jgi:hypothetical protein